jgi:hypothetical protein
VNIDDREDVRKNLLTGASYKITICEKLRLINDLTHDVNVKEHILDAYIMAKKIQRRLAYYKETYKDTTGNNGSNLKDNQNWSELTKMRKQREHS